MSDIVIKVEDLSKLYQLGQIGTGTISRDLERFWITKVLKKEDPFLKIGEINDRSKKGQSDVSWSLKDINFDINKGDAVGIIGKNGAGKSTLLKILSRVTSPTTGRIKVKGRISSLLEVGTGFHPELSGRENIYLNGAILGMRKKEISRKLDEIIDFSGVERYIDTPVKRYSSGMYVRLAFAVAAHLESEILIIDEVLAVGDAQFQKKCLGKMGDISKGEGRTILFVSHNMSAVESLCTNVISLKNGEIMSKGSPTKIISDYLFENSTSERKIQFESIDKAIGNEYIKIMYASIENESSNNKDAIIDVSSEINFRMKILNLTKTQRISIGYDLLTLKGDVVFGSGNKFECKITELTEVVCRIPSNFLNDDLYQIYVYFHTNDMVDLYSNKELLTFEVKDIKRESGYLGKINGIIRPQLSWLINGQNV
jgi:lipopolysaccharide transport system ATP-binding protein